MLLTSMAATFCFINVLMAFLGQDDLTVYFAVNAIAYLIISWAYVDLDLRSRRALNSLAMLIFIAFLVVIAVKVVKILK
jgi:hypothetical protein